MIIGKKENGVVMGDLGNGRTTRRKREREDRNQKKRKKGKKKWKKMAVEMGDLGKWEDYGKECEGDGGDEGRMA